MNTARLLGLQIDFHLTIKRVKRVSFDIPDWADDAHLRQGNAGDWGTPDGKTKVCYYKGSKPFYIDIPECKKAVEVFVSPMYNKDRTSLATDRKVLIDLYY